MVEGGAIISFGRLETSEARLDGCDSQYTIHGVLVALGFVYDERADRFMGADKSKERMKVFSNQVTQISPAVTTRAFPKSRTRDPELA